MFASSCVDICKNWWKKRWRFGRKIEEDFVEAREKTWWRMSLNYLSREDHPWRWSNQIEVNNSRWLEVITLLSRPDLLVWLYVSGDLCLVDSVGIPLWHLTWRVTRCATVCCDETHSKASSHKNVSNQTSICFAIRIKIHVDITDIHKYLIWSKVSSSLASGPSSWVERSVTAVCPEVFPCHRPSWPSPQSSPVSSSI